MSEPASIGDLQRLATALAADRIVPIHSVGDTRLDEYFQGVERHANGEWWEV